MVMRIILWIMIVSMMIRTCNHVHENYFMNHDRRHDDQNLYECMMGGSSQDGLEPLNPVDSVEGGVRQDLVHHLVIILIII